MTDRQGHHFGASEPPPYRWVNRGGRAAMLVVCDHADNAVPADLGGLGLERGALQRHIAWDIGAARVAEHLAEYLDAPAVFAGVSRLVIDCNRYPDNPQSIPTASDGVAIPGNRGLTAAEAAARRAAYFAPYHREIDDWVTGFLDRGAVPVLVSIHSFTPNFEGARRPWPVGVCWRDDDRMARAVLAHLREDVGIDAGDNQPYALDPAEDYTLIEQGLRRGLAHLLVELSQGEVGDDTGAARWATILAGAIERALADDRVRRIRHYW